MSSDIRAIYATRLADRERASAALARRDDLIARARLAVFAIAGFLVWGTVRNVVPVWWLVAPAAAFVGLVLLHARTRSARTAVERAIDFHRRALARIDERWAGAGAWGERYRDAHHPYVDDLDLFGRGSLFELLCTCRTRPGEDRLAAWLSTPAGTDEIRERQAAAAELGGALDLREATTRARSSTATASSRGRRGRSGSRRGSRGASRSCSASPRPPRSSGG